MMSFATGRLRLSTQNTTLLFYGFSLVHLLIWTLAPLLFRVSLPNDVVEGIAWGFQWQLGYNKHPPLAAWLLALATRLGGDPEWPSYLLAQLLLLSGFWAVWRLAGKILPPWPALASVMLLEGVFFYNLKSTTFTPDTLQTPLWAFLTLFFYQALSTGRRHYWWLVGLFCGLAILAKYQAAVLFVAMLSVLVGTRQGRESLKTTGPVQAIALALLVIAPHFYWSWQNQFPEIQYALRNIHKVQKSVIEVSFLQRHLLPPLLNLKNVLVTLLPVLLLGAFLYSRERVRVTFNQWQRNYVLLMGITPYLFTLLASLVSGSSFAARWNIPDFYLSGLLLMMWLRSACRPEQIRRFLIAFTVVLLLIPAVHMGYIRYRLYHWTGGAGYFHDFPAREVTARVQALWDRDYPQPLRYVAGRHYLVAFVAAYARSHPAAYFDWQLSQSAYIDEPAMRRAGAVFLWTVEKGELDRMPVAIRQRFPSARELPVMQFSGYPGGPVRFRIGIALLPPAAIATARSLSENR